MNFPTSRSIRSAFRKGVYRIVYYKHLKKKFFLHEEELDWYPEHEGPQVHEIVINRQDLGSMKILDEPFTSCLLFVVFPFPVGACCPGTFSSTCGQIFYNSLFS